MKILKVKVKGLKLFREQLEIDFTAFKRVNRQNMDMIYEITPQIHLNKAISFVGINASGKTSTLKVLSFVIDMLNNKSINSIASRDILNGLNENDEVVFETYYLSNSNTVNKLVTLISKSILKEDDDDDDNFCIMSEELWVKKLSEIKTKKDLFNFNEIQSFIKRDANEEFLVDDVSIIISLNKRDGSRIYCKDLTHWTNVNLISIFGKFPKELVAFLDPSIEYFESIYISEDKSIEAKLKFKNRDELTINSALELEKYLSSGTIKGLSVFTNAMSVLISGGYLIIDELENHFNKEIVSTLIRFFIGNDLNRKGATIVFSTHYPELLDEFERNDNIYFVRNEGGIKVDNLANLLKRNDIKKSDVYQSGYIKGTTPDYETFMDFKRIILKRVKNNEFL